MVIVLVVPALCGRFSRSQGNELPVDCSGVQALNEGEDASPHGVPATNDRMSPDRPGSVLITAQKAGWTGIRDEIHTAFAASDMLLKT